MNSDTIILYSSFTLIQFDNVTFNDVVLSTEPKMIKIIIFSSS